MAKSLKRTLIETVHSAIMNVPGIRRIYDYEWVPIDRDGIETPAIFIFFEETAWEWRNRLERITGDIILEFIHIQGEQRISVSGLELLDYEVAIHDAILSNEILRGLISKIEKKPTELQTVDNDEVHLIMRYPVVLQHTWGNQSSQTF